MKLQLTDTYALHLNITDCDYPEGHKALCVESQWTGARDPDGLQRRFHVVLSDEHWREVLAYISGQLDTSRKECHEQ